MSLDGFIATKDDDLSWLSVVEKEGEDYGYKKFNDSVDTYIVGKTTYDTILKLTGGELPQSRTLDCYVITRKSIENRKGIKFYNGDIEELIVKLKKENGKNIYCDGGGQIVKLLMDKDLIDEYIISIIPIMLGDGKRLFIGKTGLMNLKLNFVKHFETGLVQMHYSRH